jgi:hypothetical protein
MERNNAGGLAAGVYLGGWLLLNMTRVSIVNNTSSKVTTCEACDVGVGMVVWKKVQGFVVNSSLLDNTLDVYPGVVRNLACLGPFLARASVLRWNDGCDLCTRELYAAQLPLAPSFAPCLLSSDIWNSAWFLYISLAFGSVTVLGVLVGGGFWVWRKYRRQDLYAKMRRGGDAVVEERADDDAVPLETISPPRVPSSLRTSPQSQPRTPDVNSARDAAASDSGGGGGDADDVSALLEPPGYGTPLPSRDFVRHAPSSWTFKEIDYEELDLDPEPIGSGAFGLVYRATWRGSQGWYTHCLLACLLTRQAHAVAVKKFIGALNPNGVKEFRAEAQLLHGVGNHPNIIFLFGACTQGPNYCLVLPYYKRGSVRDYFKAMPEEKRTWGFVRSIAQQIVAGMIHLHRENIIHRDLAARNILIDDNDSVRITDFGLARFVQKSVANTNSNIGAVAWMSPEAVTKRQYSQKSDVWSFGVTLWEMCTGDLPFSGMEPIQVAVQISKGATLSGECSSSSA